ncbi:hypothetical protein FD755_008160 [Muntiacus reevesi]|uniref:Uncharacterized protein n=1 Tax=Muntiacus reevesi TaxID=9886 RepID=A0A5J5MIV9_MUNRE|nr:hypothetical protein FD755_008160 [Muntiacus reevesi]
MEAPAARLLLPLQLLLAACAPALGRASSDAPPLVNEDVNHLAMVTAEVVLAHAGGGSSPRAASFLLALEPELEARLDEEENNLEVREIKIKGKSGRFSTWCLRGAITSSLPTQTRRRPRV